MEYAIIAFLFVTAIGYELLIVKRGLIHNMFAEFFPFGFFTFMLLWSLLALWKNSVPYPNFLIFRGGGLLSFPYELHGVLYFGAGFLGSLIGKAVSAG